jgi:hypothetical protein
MRFKICRWRLAVCRERQAKAIGLYYLIQVPSISGAYSIYSIANSKQRLLSFRVCEYLMSY